MIDSPLLLLVLLAAIAATPLLLRRYKATQPDGVRVLSRTALSRNSVVAVIAIGQRRLLLGAGEQGVHLLADVTDAEDGTGRATSHATSSTATTMTFTTDLDELSAVHGLDRRDAVQDRAMPDTTGEAALDALRALTMSHATPAGPRIGLFDRLRAMTVRTPDQGRPLHVPLLRR